MGDMSEEEWEQIEKFRERVCDEGELVFTKDWNSGGPGAGGGTECVSRWEGKFYAWSADIGFNGPYLNLKDALAKHEMLSVTSATTSIWCPLMTTDDLLKEIETCDDYPPDQIEVNSEVCLRSGKHYLL